MEIELERLREALGESDAHTHIRGDRTRMREGGREGGRGIIRDKNENITTRRDSLIDVK